MINIKELRIGNLLDNCGQWCFVMSIYKNNKVELGYFKDSIGFVRSLDDLAIKPIPLTEQWLIDFGFEWKNDNNLWLNGFCLKAYDNEFYVLTEQKRVFIKFVHTLQNLYFALTGEELTKK